MGQSIREDIGALFASYHLTKTALGLRILNMILPKSCLVIIFSLLLNTSYKCVPDLPTGFNWLIGPCFVLIGNWYKFYTLVYKWILK